MISFLADENISPETADHLQTLGHSCRSLCRRGPWQLSDSEIVALAREEGQIILTHDLDFGQLYYFRERGEIGIIVLRLRNQTVESVNEVLTRFLEVCPLKAEELGRSLVIVRESSYRVFRGPRGEF